MTNFSRRTLLKGTGALATGLAIPSVLSTAASAATFGEMMISGPPAPPTIYLAHLAQQPSMAALADKVTFNQWRSPDMLISMVTKGHVHFSATPSNVAAMLYNKGGNLKLMDVTTWGILHLLTRRDDIKSLTDLKGKKLTSFFRGGMPDIVVRYLAGQLGLDMDNDVEMSYASTPLEAMKLFMAGRFDTVILPEPAVTAAKLQSKMIGKPLNAIDIQQVWAEVTGRDRIPQAGTLIRADIVEEHPEVARAIMDGVKASVNWMNTDKDGAAQLGASEFNLPAPMVRKSLENTRMEYVSAVDAREELEFFYEALASLNPKLIGGKLPDDGFYMG